LYIRKAVLGPEKQLLPGRRSGFVARWAWAGANLDVRFAQQAGDEVIAIAVFDQHVLAAFRVGALNGKDHGKDPRKYQKHEEESHD
jgi:hypothetical protein